METNTFTSEELTLEKLPKAFNTLLFEVRELKGLLLQKQEPITTEKERWFDLNELCNYHPDKPSKATVYGWVNAGLVPVHKSAKKLRFLKSEIDTWLKTGRKYTIAEIEAAAQNFIGKKKRG